MEKNNKNESFYGHSCYACYTVRIVANRNFHGIPYGYAVPSRNRKKFGHDNRCYRSCHLYQIGNGILGPVLGRIIDLFGKKNSLLIALLTFAASYAAIYFFPKLPLLCCRVTHFLCRDTHL